MRISVSRGEHQVEIAVLGRSRRRLRHAAQVALQLLGDPADNKPEQPFGFALGADVELADPD